MKDALYIITALTLLAAAALVINEHTHTFCIFGNCATIVH